KGARCNCFLLVARVALRIVLRITLRIALRITGTAVAWQPVVHTVVRYEVSLRAFGKAKGGLRARAEDAVHVVDTILVIESHPLRLGVIDPSVEYILHAGSAPTRRNGRDVKVG